ncbi:membrane hypothetical protein [Desulfamplus magnetovallimortis]|uniref:O-antigen ligase-related domain-containing protein n=1 Tax=Desulfamplus magnetovallimortis TaxID=1246637 RepID=A0A1W1H8F0_9BACT|nr:O-antigen ligase family protein [Desulfamplus magnetovallimortis]SLM28742.1 membrane hypothetical protein [Desulfamplus magnetovallimortis]
MLDLKKTYQGMEKSDRVIFTLVGMTFFFLPIGTAPPLMCIILASATALFSGKLVDAGKMLKSPWAWPLLAMILLPWVGLLYVPELTDVSWDYARKTHYWFYAIVIALLPVDKRAVIWIVKAFLAGLAINALFAMIQYAGLCQPPSPSGIKGYFGFGVIYSALSMYLVAGILAASFFFRSSSQIGIKVFNLILIILFLFHITIMDGRNGYMTFLLLSPMVAVNIVGRLEWKKVTLLCIIFVLCMSFSPVLQKRINGTIKNLKLYKQVILNESWGKDVISQMPRFYLVRAAVDIFMDNPIAGAGTGGYRYYTAQEQGGAQSHPHSNILYMGASFGLIGLFVYLWICWVMFEQAWRLKQELSGYFALSIFLVIFISGFFNSQILDSGPALFFAMGYGLLGRFKSSDQWNVQNGTEKCNDHHLDYE